MVIPGAYELYRSGTQIDWIAGRLAASVLACYSWINVIAVDEGKLLGGNAAERISSIAALWRRLAGRRYDLCATLYYDRRYKAIALPVAAGRKFSLSHTDRETRLLPGRPYMDEFARILLGEADTCRSSSLAPVRPECLPPAPVARDSKRVRVAMVPAGASNMLRQQTLRRWPSGLYVQVARALLEQGYEVVLVGGPEDTWVRSEFADLPVTDTIGRMSLPQVIALFDSCDLVVSHDTGPMHLAGVSMAHLLALFGPTNPNNFMPRREGVRAIWGGEGFACRPCYDGTTFAPCHENGCMRQITVEMVLAQIREMIEERSVGQASAHRVLTP